MKLEQRAGAGLVSGSRALAAILLLAVLVYLPSLGFGFVEWDDPLYLTQNPLVRDGAKASLAEHLLTPKLGYPVPLTVASYRIEHAVFGLSRALPYHATNVLLHLLAIALVFSIARRLALSVAASALAAIVLGLHPATAESVSWVTGRKDLLVAACTLGALLLALPRAPLGERARASMPALVASAALCVLAVLAKPTGACATLVAAFAVSLRLGGKPGLALAARTYAIPALIVLASIPIAVRNHDAIHGHRTVAGFSLLREAWYALGYHLGIVAMARPNAAKYLPTPWPPPFDPWVDIVPFVALALAVLAYRKIDASDPRRSAARIGAVLAIAAYLPSSSLIPLTRVVADAYVHTSLAGVGLLLGALLDALVGVGLARAPGSTGLQPVLRWAPGVSCAVLALGLALRAHAASARFEDSFTLWAANYAAFPHDYRSCRNAGNGLYVRSGPAAALAFYEACAARHGAEPFERNRALVLVELGRLEEAEPILRHVLSREPGDAAAAGALAHVLRLRGERAGVPSHSGPQR